MGFEIEAQQAPKSNPSYCVEFSNQAHHVRILNNVIFGCGGGGIGSAHADYLTIVGNIIHNTSAFSIYEESAISMWQNWNFDNDPGYHNNISNNICYNNSNQVGVISDGNGVIIDDSRNTQNNSTLPPYTGKTIVENNIVYLNGGRGIHVYESDFVDVFNNVVYQNMQSPQIKTSELSAINSGSVHFINNIVYTTPNASANTAYGSKNIMWSHNLYWNTIHIDNKGIGDKIGNPLFINPPKDFHVSSQSPAIGSGTFTRASDTDFNGMPRPLSGSWDLGPYDYVKSLQ